MQLTTPYTHVDIIYKKVTTLDSDSSKLLRWFKGNGIASNLTKFQTIFLRVRRQLCPNIEKNKVPATDHVNLLGVKIDIQCWGLGSRTAQYVQIDKLTMWSFLERVEDVGYTI